MSSEKDMEAEEDAGLDDVRRGHETKNAGSPRDQKRPGRMEGPPLEPPEGTGPVDPLISCRETLSDFGLPEP